MPEPCDVQMGKHDKPQIITKKHGKSLSVLSIKDTWRVDDEWWTNHPISRQYYTILLENLSVTFLEHLQLTFAYNRPRRRFLLFQFLL